MTTEEIITSFIGFLIIAAIVALLGIVITSIFWHVIFNGADFSNMEFEEKEDKEDKK